jgi:hypothetical protein
MTAQLGDTPTPDAQPTAPRRSRNWFWPGFALGFLLLASLTCTASVFLTGLNRLDISDLGGQSAAAWTPPPVMPTVPATAPDTDAASDTPALGAYRPGEQVRNITPSLVNIRATPGYLGKPAGDVVAQVMPGDAVEIVSGPVVADNLTWWRVRPLVPGAGAAEGWMAEATASGVQIMGR